MNNDLVTLGAAFLEHYGVKGMKWGVRRSPKQLARARSERREASKSDDKKRHDTNRKKGTDNLSDKDLQKLVNRMNMEQNYSRMNPSKLKRGQAAAATVLAVGATANQVIAFANSPAGKKLSNAIKG